MPRTRIFVSSTCYDLSQEREDIKRAIEAMGHEALLSEYTPFPIDPDRDTVENSRQVVKEHTDVLVLVIGGRRGSVEAQSGQSVTNLEYRTAVNAHIPVYVFIKSQVYQLLDVWRNNPEADFELQVDDPAVFEFIERVEEEGHWHFTFDRASEIEQILRDQLSIALRDLLQRRREGRLVPPAEFANESERVRDIATDKPPYWEFLLTEALLRDKLEPAKRLIADFDQKTIYRRMRLISTCQESFDDLQIGFQNLTNAIEVLMTLVNNRLKEAWGPTGHPGDALQIKATVEGIADIAFEWAKWDIDLSFTQMPQELDNFKSLLQGLTGDWVRQIFRVPEKIAAIFDEPEPSGERVIQMVLESPNNIPEINQEIERIGRLFS